MASLQTFALGAAPAPPAPSRGGVALGRRVEVKPISAGDSSGVWRQASLLAVPAVVAAGRKRSRVLRRSWAKGRNLVGTNTKETSNEAPSDKRISILGSTGSIGTQTLDICRQFPGRFKPVALAAGRNIELLLEQIKEFQPQMVACDESKLEELKEGVKDLKIPDYDPELLSGPEGQIEVARHPDCKTVVTGIVGCAGLIPTIEAIKAKKDIALANKETIIAGGPVIAPLIEEYGVSMLPVDSEHSAIFQCMQGIPKGGVKKIILTGSGGTFRDMSLEDMKKEDPEVLRQRSTTHPNWDMGAKITVDSSTMMNKGLEVIEAHWLYGVEYDDIEVVIHPQSIVHSAVECQDTAILMQTGWPDMRLPILYALSHPSRVPADLPNPRDGRNFDDWWIGDGKDGKLTFGKPDLEKYPCIRLAYKAGRIGGTMPAILSAANEQAVELLLTKEIDFLDIPSVLEKVMDKAEAEKKADHGQERPPDSPRQKPDVERIPWAADSAVSTAASSGANVKHKDLKAHEKGDKNGKSDARTSERTDISCTHGPGAEGDPVGVLLGAENLPMVGAAGVLVLPRRQAEKAPEKVPEKSRKKAQVDFTDLVALLADEELDGWGGAEEPAWQLFERRKEQQNFHRYVEDSVASGGAAAEPELDMEQVRTLTLDQPAAKPSQGPGIRQLAQEPARREECPVCQAEWIVALRCMQEGKPPPEKEALALQPVKKQPNSAKKYQKMLPT